MAKRLRIPGTGYLPIRVWDGHYHEVGVRVLDRDDPEGTRWDVQRALQNAAGFGTLWRFNKRAARKRKRHWSQIGRRDLARRFLVQVERLVQKGLVSVIFDGERIRTERRWTSR